MPPTKTISSISSVERLASLSAAWHGLIEVFIDGSDKPAYRFEGPLYSNVGKKKPKVNCYLKIGPVAEQNKIALRKEVREELGEITENMVVWYDALAIGKTREKVMELVEKDK